MLDWWRQEFSTRGGRVIWLANLAMVLVLAVLISEAASWERALLFTALAATFVLLAGLLRGSAGWRRAMNTRRRVALISFLWCSSFWVAAQLLLERESAVSAIGSGVFYGGVMAAMFAWMAKSRLEGAPQ